MNAYDVIVIGAGPAGLLAAGSAAQEGARVLVLEKMPREGRKLLITGKGRCNITNSAPVSEFIKHVYPNGRFLKSAFANFYSSDIIDLLNRYGVDTILERGGRYFPANNKAADVLKALLKWMQDCKVEIRCKQKVEKIITKDKQAIGVMANGQSIACSTVILATGGKSYPGTGSTGDGYSLSQDLGHKVENVRPALVPLETSGDIAQKLQGLNLKNVKAVVWVNGKKKGEAFGEMIFTHFGLSGPIILTLSRFIVDDIRAGNTVKVSIDLKPAQDEQKLDKRLQRDLNEHGKKQLINLFKQWLPASMIPVFLESLELDGQKACHQVNAKERKAIRFIMKNLTFDIIGHRSFKEAIITAGGIDLSEVSPKTMASKRIKNLYFAGEVLDLDAETGGYNLQIAYSTGWLAGKSCIKKAAAPGATASIDK